MEIEFFNPDCPEIRIFTKDENAPLLFPYTDTEQNFYTINEGLPSLMVRLHFADSKFHLKSFFFQDGYHNIPKKEQVEGEHCCRLSAVVMEKIEMFSRGATIVSCSECEALLTQDSIFLHYKEHHENPQQTFPQQQSHPVAGSTQKSVLGIQPQQIQSLGFSPYIPSDQFPDDQIHPAPQIFHDVDNPRLIPSYSYNEDPQQYLPQQYHESHPGVGSIRKSVIFRNERNNVTNSNQQCQKMTKWKDKVAMSWELESASIALKEKEMELIKSEKN